MSLQKSRDRIYVKGLGTLQLRQIDPTVGAAFLNAGYLQATTLTDLHEMEVVKPETGQIVDYLEKDRIITVDTGLLQSGIDEINLLRQSPGLTYAARYCGLARQGAWQYFGFDAVKFDASLKLQYQPGVRPVPVKFQALYQPDSIYSVPEYYTIQKPGMLTIDDVNFWCDAAAQVNVGTQYALDIGGFGYHGTMGSDYGTIWQNVAGLMFYRFNGTLATDFINFGNPTGLNDDATADWIFEVWVRFQGSNGTRCPILCKKSVIDDNTAGWAVYRTTGNLISFRLGSGSASVIVSNSSTSTANVWRHFAVTVDRTGNATPYMNGLTDGSAASVAALGTGTNALNVLMAGDSATGGQIDVGAVRIHKYPTGVLSPNAAAIIAQHFATERSIYGI